MTPLKNALTLANWRRRVAEMYAAVRHAPNPEAAWHDFRAARDALFLNHPQTPLTAEQRAQFSTIPYYDYDPAWRTVGTLVGDVEPYQLATDLPADGEFRYTRVGRVHFSLGGHEAFLSLYWVNGYGGGLFLPFKDATSGRTTYGAGRYLYDAIKGADLSGLKNELILDFNFSYNPSCSYNDQWVCPLAPAENWLSFEVTAGEQMMNVRRDVKIHKWVGVKS